ncbi:MAG: peptidase and in kexin sedolisin [Frankiales bacterium]|nr:peptidase and in kexin sedolisin [Frankiales bacterium]
MRRPASLVLAVGLVLLAAPVPARAQTAATPCNKDTFQLIPSRPYALSRFGALRTWQRTTGEGVVVAVVDSGVDHRNPHLAGAVLPGVSLLPGDPDQNGWTDATSHGTAVAGTIAARKIKGSGVIGLARDAKILPIRVYEADDDAALAKKWQPDAGRIAAGIRIAADRGARIINVSMSQPTPDPRLDAAVAYALRRGSLVVASAGNRQTTTDKRDTPHYPGASPGALAVGAVDVDDQVAADSVRGPHVDLVAVGAEVATSYLDRGDCLLQGDSTSMATGYTSAAAALVAQVYPTATPQEIAYRLEASADRPVRGARDDARGWGLLQPLDAVTMTLDPTRPGPPVPGGGRAVRQVAAAQHIDVRPRLDPAAPQRSQVVWWLLFGVPAVGLALLGSWWTSRPTRP